jgi:hypothetical protein
MTLLEEIQQVANNHGWDSRRYRYKILAEITGVPEDICEKICSLERNIRWAFPVDDVGIAKEQKYHKPKSMFDYEIESEKLLKDKLKYL